MIEEDVSARLALSRVTEPGDPRMGELLLAHEASHVWSLVRDAADEGSLRSVRALTTLADMLGYDSAQQRTGLAKWAQRWNARMPAVDNERDLRAARTLGAHLLTPSHPHWPRRLDDLAETSPWLLWVRGKSSMVNADASVSIVGTRTPSAYGDYVAQAILAGISTSKILVVSGGAYGIDAHVHRGSLEHNLPSVAVLAGGVDRLYPQGNKKLLQRLIDHGALVSEMPVGVAPSRVRFLRRNRIIAGLGDVTTVIEAAWRSGSLSTAHHAAGLGRAVMAVPGPVTSAQSAGCHRLIAEGYAALLGHPADLETIVNHRSSDRRERHADIGSDQRENSHAEPGVQRTGDMTGSHRQDDLFSRESDSLHEGERLVYDALSPFRARFIDDLVAASGLSHLEVREILGILELKQLVICEQQGYRRVAENRSPGKY